MLSAPLTALIIAAAGGCAVVSGVFGMGGGMILMGILAAALPVGAAMILHGVIQLVANGSRAFMLRRSIDFHVLKWFCVGAAGSLALFAWLQVTVDKRTLFLFLGGLPLLFAILPRVPELDVTRPRTAATAGILVTSVQLVAGVSGPALDVFFLRGPLDRYRVVATKAAVSMLGHVCKLVYYALLLSSGTEILSLPLVAAVVIAAIVGTKLGKHLLGKLSEHGFRRYTRWLLAAIALVYCARGLS